MEKIRFESDYTRGAHPRILARIAEMNDTQAAGYGEDVYTKEAGRLIKAACELPNADVHLFMGGTQTNLTVIAASLRAYEAVISPSTGHILVAETGAIEATGHHIISVPHKDGKITACQVREIASKPENVHFPMAKMLYLTFSTELGTLYTKAELQAMRDVCDEFGLWLFIDGARLGYGLASSETDITLPEIAKLCDVFYIGGNKIGALFGEAVVINREEIKHGFRHMMKQRGGLMAKGKVLGVQFIEMFKDSLYFEMSEHAIKMAAIAKQGFEEAGIKIIYPPQTNLFFIELTYDQFEKISEKYVLSVWERQTDKMIARFCTDWATREDEVKLFLEDLKNL